MNAPAPQSRPRRAAVVAVFLLAALPRIRTTGNFMTTDEPTWLRRSQRFSQALLDGDPSEMTASLGEPATMPGAIVMWIGTLARWLWNLGGAVGITDAGGDISNRFEVLEIAQVLAALVNSALIALLFALVWRWVGVVAAGFTAVVIATEPWVVGLGSVLHTDHLTALFGLTGAVALALALGVPDPERRSARPMLLGAVAGGLLAQAPLTKISGLGYGPLVLVIVGLAIVESQRDTDVATERTTLPLGDIARVTAVAAGVALVSVPLSWPAIAADFGDQFANLRGSAELGTAGHTQFYRGEVTQTPGPSFYFYVLPLRMTPWALAAVVALVPIALARAATRRAALILLIGTLPLWLTFSAAAKQFDRYGLLLLFPLFLVAGLGASTIRIPPKHRRGAGRAALVAVTGVALYSWAVAPYGLAYYNPGLGGADTAAGNLLIGWDDGMDRVADTIRELEDGDCEGVSADGIGIYAFFGFECLGLPVGIDDDGQLVAVTADYTVVYVSKWQRDPTLIERVANGREPVAEVEIRGLRYALVFANLEEPPP